MNTLQPTAQSCGSLDNCARSASQWEWGKVVRIEQLNERFERFAKELSAGDLRSTTKLVYLSRIRTFQNSLCDTSLQDRYVSLEGDFRSATRHFFATNSYTAGTVNGYLTIFKLFAEFVGIHNADYAGAVTHYKVPECLSPRLFNRYMEAARQGASERDAFLIHLIAYSPIPVKTILNLRVADFAIQHGDCSGNADVKRIQINYRKGKHQYFYVIENNFADLAAAWLQRFDLTEAHTVVFPSLKGFPLSLTAADYAIRSLGWKCCIEVSVNKLRSAAAASRVLTVAS